MNCPHCGEPTGATDEFCESCGTDLTGGAPAPETVPDPSASPSDRSVRTHLIAPPGAGEPASADGPTESAAITADAFAPCSSCGGEVGSDGWCTVCGARANNGRDHVVEQPSPTVAGVSDRGIRHPRNEDACALHADGDLAVLVVCDGVTSAPDSEIASLAAARAARDLLASDPRPSDSSPAARIDHWAERLKAAALTADAAADDAAKAVGPTQNPPSTTFVAAVADGALMVAAWVGDSRAYWLPDAGPAEQLSTDDSWASDQVRQGVSREVAEADSRAHAITRWLGADSPPVDASTSTTTAGGPGWLLVCSDGLWNYCSEASDIGQLVAGKGGDPLAVAESLVAWANSQGGHDNVTATLARVLPPPPETNPQGAP